MRNKLVAFSVLLFLMSFVLWSPLKEFTPKGAKTIFQLSQLKQKDTLSVEYIYLSESQLSEFPMEICRFPNLKSLDLSRNNIIEIPKEVADMKALESLSLNGNGNIDLKLSLSNLKGSNIKELSISSCMLLFIPSDICNLNSLEYIDLSNNNIIDVPLYFGKLTKLKELNLSHNNIENLDFTIYKMKGLEFLNLENNKNLDMQNVCLNLLPLKNLEEVKFSHLSDTLPHSFGAIKTQSLSITESSISYLTPEIQNNKSLQSILFYNSPKTDFNHVLQILAGVNDLTEISMINCFNEVPSSIKLCSKITHLNLSDNGLTEFNYTEKDFPFLKQLVLYNNNFSNETLKKLVNNFPNTSIITDVDHNFWKSDGSDSIVEHQVVSAPFPDLVYPDTVFTINTIKENVLKFEDTEIIIPQGSFVDSKNNVIKDPVVINYKEYKDEVDVFLAGIPMTYDSAGVSYMLETAGMFDISAQTKSGDEVFINPDKPLTVNFISTTENEGFNEYEFDKETNNWVYTKPAIAEILPPLSNDSITYCPANNKPRLIPQSIYFYTKDNKNKQKSIELESEVKNYNESISPTFILAQPSVLFKDFTFMYYNTLNYKKFVQDVKEFLSKEYKTISVAKGSKRRSSKRITNKELMDFTFEIDSERDCFLATFVYYDTLVELPLKINFNGTNDKEQLKYKAFWQTYLKEKDNLEKANNQAIRGYENALFNYENELTVCQTYARTNYFGNGNMYKTSKARQVLYFSLTLFTMGLKNWDHIIRPKPIEKDEIELQITGEGENIEVDKLYVMDKTIKYTSEFKSNKVRCYLSNSLIVIAITKLGDFAIAYTRDLKKTRNNNVYNVDMKIVNSDQKDVSELKQLFKL